MIHLIYNIALSLALLPHLPKAIKRGRKPRKIPFFQRDPKRSFIWMHAVSVGEVRAASTLFKELKSKHPDAQIGISVTTETGLAEAKRSLPEADLYFLLPLDFPLAMNRLVNRLRPTLFIQVESDFWLNLLSALKKSGCKIALVNGKMSEKSAQRHSHFPSFGRKLFSYYDLLALQSDEYLSAFQKIGGEGRPLFVTGNLKYDALSQPVEKLKERLFLKEDDFVVTVGSTHEGEEKPLIEALRRIEGVKVLLAPRHPERFDSVALDCEIRSRLSKEVHPNDSVVLIDQMGLLKSCYAFSDLAIVAGSFTDKVGGHNIFEPFEYGTPALFGPFMFGQKKLAEEALDAGAGLQVPLDEIETKTRVLKDEKELLSELKKRALNLSEKKRGSTKRTIALLEKHGLC